LTDALIRPARSDDAEALHRHCYPLASLDDVRDYLIWSLRQADKGWMVRLVAEVDGQAVANAQLTIWGQTGEIGSLVVGPAFRRRGLARRLLETLIAEGRQRDLSALEISVQEDQPATLSFYEQLGFRQIQDTKKGDAGPTTSRPDITLRLSLL
jgi:ribosomal-protein-alanine N-acetyltransferase